MKLTYLDNAATTQLHPDVLQAMMPHLTEEFGNPSSIYPLGVRAQRAVNAARESIAEAIGATEKEIYFTSGGTEADNWAIKGVACANAKKGKHIITSAIEHHAVLHTCQALEKQGFEVTYLPVDEEGRISPQDFENAIRPDTILATIMLANNEIGTMEPIAQLASIAREHGVLFHTDAVQAFGHEAVDVNDLNVDLLSASAHKLYGPKGVGMLYVRKGVRINNLLDGGQQERGKRATTENVPGIVGFARAVELVLANREQEHTRQRKLRNHAIERIEAEIPYCRLNGSRDFRLANNVNFSFQFIEGEGMLLRLAGQGICASSGSACTSGSLDPSHVLLGIGLPHEIAHGSLRLSFGNDTTLEDVDFTIDVLKEAIEGLRSMSPLWEDFQNNQSSESDKQN